MNMHNTTAIITGGTGALGSVVVEAFFNAGANVALPVHSKSFTHQLPQPLLQAADRFMFVETDLSVESQVMEFVQQVREKFQAVDFLVNIAGGYAGGNPIANVSLDEWESQMSMNLKTTFLMCREVLKRMYTQKSGRIVNIAAMPALTSGANKGPYAISKRGVIALTETIADETKGTGITANAIAPSIILTEGNKHAMPKADFTKWVTPQEIADAILFLCSKSARSMSGNVVRMFGGV